MRSVLTCITDIQALYLNRRPNTLHIQTPTCQCQRFTLNLTQAARIELHVARAVNFNHWYLRRVVAVHSTYPAQQVAGEYRSQDTVNFCLQTNAMTEGDRINAFAKQRQLLRGRRWYQ